ncbi:MAG TPA: sigma 54-interacting transcriptional regulator [Myxococcales bacterium]|nr:sigma 54-interacting transcriptional regulator [Myxococcales bacterium]
METSGARIEAAPPEGGTPALGARRIRSAAAGAAPELVVAIHCDAPLAGSSRHSLAGLDSAVLGRGDDRRATRRDGARQLLLELPDRWVSSVHARLLRREGGWSVADAGSRNGTLVNGAPCTEAVLRDGDLIEVGRTFLCYREAAACGGPDDEDGRRLRPAPPGVATIAPAMSCALALLPAIARTALPAIVVGESGTGKELIARALHALSGRRGPFQAINCAAIAQTLLESELFGSRKGAFSGATEDRPGLVRAADGGTLFLDEIGDLPLPAQAALLRVLQESEVLPLGATRPVRVDVRVVAAAQRDLRSLVAAGRFRPDLFARLDAFTVELPPLRERREDLGLLTGALLRRLAPDRCERLRFEPEAARALLRYGWPLNVRELELSLATALALCGDGPIEAVHLPEPVRRGQAFAAGPGATAGGRREELVVLLHQHGGNVAEVARVLGKGRMQIHRWARRYDIDLASFRR